MIHPAFEIEWQFGRQSKGHLSSRCTSKGWKLRRQGKLASEKYDDLCIDSQCSKRVLYSVQYTNTERMKGPQLNDPSQLLGANEGQQLVEALPCTCKTKTYQGCCMHTESYSTLSDCICTGCHESHQFIDFIDKNVVFPPAKLQGIVC